MVSGHQDVIRLDVAVDDSLTMRVSQCIDDVAKDAHHLIDRQFVVTSQSCPKGLARDERHRVMQQPSFGTSREDWYDVRMLQPRRQLDLALEPLGAQARRKFRGEDLDDDLSIEC